MNFGYRNTFQLIDKGNIEVFGPVGIGFNSQILSKNLTVYQSGIVSNYAVVLVLFALLTLCISIIKVLGLTLLFCDDSFLVLVFCYLISCFAL
jgi:Flp pilus assembly protein TadB